MATPRIQVLTLDQLLEMLASDDGMREAMEAGRASEACDDPDCIFCHPENFPHVGKTTKES